MGENLAEAAGEAFNMVDGAAKAVSDAVGSALGADMGGTNPDATPPSQAPSTSPLNGMGQLTNITSNVDPTPGPGPSNSNSGFNPNDYTGGTSLLQQAGPQPDANQQTNSIYSPNGLLRSGIQNVINPKLSRKPRDPDSTFSTPLSTTPSVSSDDSSSAWGPPPSDSLLQGSTPESTGLIPESKNEEKNEERESIERFLKGQNQSSSSSSKSVAQVSNITNIFNPTEPRSPSWDIVTGFPTGIGFA